MFWEFFARSEDKSLLKCALLMAHTVQLLMHDRTVLLVLKATQLIPNQI